MFWALTALVRRLEMMKTGHEREPKGCMQPSGGKAREEKGDVGGAEIGYRCRLSAD